MAIKKKKQGPIGLAGTDANTERKTWDVRKIWTEKLGKPFTPVSSYFLENYHRLRYPITPTEFLLIIHLLKYKWDEAMPFPAIATLAKKMLRSDQAVRSAARTLEKKGYLRRHMTRGRPNHFDLTHLFRAIEKLFDEDAAKKAENNAKTTRPTVRRTA